MKSKSWLLILIPIIVILIYVSIPSNETKPNNTSADSTAWVQWKKEKDENLKNGEESPILNKEAFSGLSYYPYNPIFAIDCKVKKAEKNRRITLQMTDGTEEELSYFGEIEGQVQGETIQLSLYQHDNGDLFLPFKDKTAPQETYGGGRYLDIPISSLHDSGILINFNYAYHPYCAYNKNFACPVPPKENNLSIRIEAGERN
jgi:uncharacterized protein (DUF1684 family)